uniref:Uncharacterized protein n=1 Tax=Arundo donax TaxID=35708 RepID=A0A0A8XTP2_ARUDO
MKSMQVPKWCPRNKRCIRTRDVTMALAANTQRCPSVYV